MEKQNAKEEALCAACWPSNTFFSGGLIGKKLELANSVKLFAFKLGSPRRSVDKTAAFC